MTDDHRNKLARLARCRFLPGSFDKRFVQNLHGAPSERELSVKQVECLEKIWHRYRKQLGESK